MGRIYNGIDTIVSFVEHDVVCHQIVVSWDPGALLLVTMAIVTIFFTYFRGSSNLY